MKAKSGTIDRRHVLGAAGVTAITLGMAGKLRAQERGEVRTAGKPNSSKAEEFGAADIGLTHKDIHEARQIRNAEEAVPSGNDLGLTPIMALFRQWETEWRREDGDILAIERKMLALPSSSAADFAAKFVAHTGYGAFCVDENSPLYWEALALTGGTHGGALIGEGNAS